MKKEDMAAVAAMLFVLGSVIGFWLGLRTGVQIGPAEFNAGRIVCQEKLDKQVECWRKDQLPK